MKQTTATISELAQLAYDLPMGGRIEFSGDRDENFWGLKKIKIFDGPLLVVGSYGGGLTSALDIQIDGEKEEIEEFLEGVLEEHIIDEVYIREEEQPERIPVSYNEIIEQLRWELSDEIVKVMTDNNVREVNIQEHEVYVAWFNGDNEGFDSGVSSVLLNENDKIELNVISYEEDIVHLDYHIFSCRHVEWLNDILNAINTIFTIK